MQPFYGSHSVGEHHARLSSAATERRELLDAAAPRRPRRWRLAVGRALVRTGNRLVAEHCDLAYVDRGVRPS